MIEPPQITELARHRTTAVIHVRCTREEIHLVMGRGVRELLDTIQLQGANPVAALYTHHLRRPTDCFDFEIGVPVDQAIAASGRVHPSDWPAMLVARTVHTGRYENLPDSWGEFQHWIQQQGRETTSDLWECYLSGPERGLDARMWRTELIQPLTH